MDKAALFLGAVVLALLIAISLLLPQLNTARADVEEAREFSGSVRQLLNAIDVRCTARTGDFSGIQDCIEPVLRRNDFEIDSFREFDERRNESGLLVIKNEGSRTYAGSEFALLKNGEEVARGCHITSEILAEYTCRFDLTEPCIEGDVFAVTYGSDEPLRLVTRTC